MNSLTQRYKMVLGTLAIFVMVFIIVKPVKADGIIIPEPMPCSVGAECPWKSENRPMAQLDIKYHHVDVLIDNQIATTHVDQVFYNPNEISVEGSYVFPLPVDSVIEDFTLWIDGAAVKGNVLEANEARSIYEDIVRELRDPALLEYIGRGAIQAQIFPIPPGGERRIELKYNQVLTQENGLVRYTYPLNTEKFSARPIENVSVSVQVTTQEAVRAVYSPSHSINSERIGNRQFSASYEENNVLPDQDFALYYSLGESEAFHLFSYRNPMEGDDSDGFFMLLLAPRPGDLNQIVEKDVLLVIDRSGSMDGEKFLQAQAALKYILKNLHSRDRFYLMAFSDSVKEYSGGLQSANQSEIAIDWVDHLSAAGSTDINRALLDTVAVADGSRPTYLLFLTDGLPTTGEVDSQNIMNNLIHAAPNNLRLFSFGVGYDVDTFLLDSLSRDHQGLTSYVQPGEQIDEVLSGFYQKISTPVLTDLELDFGEIVTYDMYPNPLPDLFAGNQVVVVGRYHEGGITDIKLRGLVNNQTNVFEYQNERFLECGQLEKDTMSLLPRLWATRKVGYLLNKIRLEGRQVEIVEQVVKLSIRYGIVTPYTSYLVTEPMPIGEENIDAIADEVLRESLAAPESVSGQSAVEKAAEEGELSQAQVSPSLLTNSAKVVKLVGSRTYVLTSLPINGNKSIWVDTAFDPLSMDPIPVAFLSDDYFALARLSTDIGSALALDPYVIVLIDNVAYEIVDEGTLTNPFYLPHKKTGEIEAPTDEKNLDAISSVVPHIAIRRELDSIGVAPVDVILPCFAILTGSLMVLIAFLARLMH